MKLSFKTSPQHTEWAPLRDVWLAADEMPELTGGWLFDHFYPINTDDTTGPCFEGWTALAYLAGVTQRLRLGLMVSGNTYRHPAVLANMCATIDIASGGRLDIGLGAAWNEQEHAAYGIPFPPVGVRMDALEEACEVLHGLLTQRTTTFAGQHYRLTDAYCEPKPIQQPHPPFAIGGGGEKRTLRIVARWADHWNYPGRDGEGLRAKLAILHEHCGAVGRDPGEIEVSVHLFDPSPSAESVATAKELADAGCDHLIMYFMAPLSVEQLRTTTSALVEAGL